MTWLYINAESVCALLRGVAEASVGLPITLVLDNARYQKCAPVQTLAASLGIERLQREQAHQQRQGRPTHAGGQRLRHARAAGDAAVARAEDVRPLGQWLRHDVLAVAGPCHAERR